jgi:hypothetical protein
VILFSAVDLVKHVHYPDVAGSAGKALPGAIANLTFQGRPEAAIEKCRSTTEEASRLLSWFGAVHDDMASHQHGTDATPGV